MNDLNEIVEKTKSMSWDFSDSGNDSKKLHIQDIFPRDNTQSDWGEFMSLLILDLLTDRLEGELDNL